LTKFTASFWRILPHAVGYILRLRWQNVSVIHICKFRFWSQSEKERKRKTRKENKVRHPLHLRHQIISYLLKFFSRNDTNRRWPYTPCTGFREAHARKHSSIAQIKTTSLHKLPLAYTNWRSNESYFTRSKVLISGPSIGQHTVNLPSDAIRYELGLGIEFEYVRKWTSQTNYIEFVWRTCHEPFCASNVSAGQRSSTTVLEGQVLQGSLTDSALLASTANYSN